MSFMLMLDIAVASLLVIVIIYAASLNKRLARLRADKDKLEVLAKNFSESTVRVEESMTRLRQAAADVQLEISRTENLRDDLVFLGERGASTADRLEQLIREARDNLGVSPANSPQPNSSVRPKKKEVQGVGENESEIRSDAERKLLEALRATDK